MKAVIATNTWEGTEYVFEWRKTSSFGKLKPITQVYGVCFDSKGEILVIRKVGDRGSWIIPGGHPEENETLEKTLKREMLEEADVQIKNINLIGVQKVCPKGKPKEFVYQLRCSCDLEKLLPQTPDPDNQEIWERKFVPPNKIMDYVKWGITGKAMFKDVINSHKLHHP